MRRCDATQPVPFLVTFKLETNDERMRCKALANLKQYKCDAVVANMLQDYKDHVYVYLCDNHKNDDLSTSPEPIHIERTADCPIEMQLVRLFIDRVNQRAAS
uniref:Phosphopantothenate--cysteine ligase 1 n=1 Tax=Lygus hesperus TaxID=30085 RepID=A0A0A9Z5Z3_LYGHE